jgi:hypothetical protein
MVQIRALVDSTKQIILHHKPHIRTLQVVIVSNLKVKSSDELRNNRVHLHSTDMLADTGS